MSEPELAFERQPANVRRATTDLHIGYPVALDSDYAIWHAFPATASSCIHVAVTWPSHLAVSNQRADIMVHIEDRRCTRSPQSGRWPMPARGRVREFADQPRLAAPSLDETVVPPRRTTAPGRGLPAR